MSYPVLSLQFQRFAGLGFRDDTLWNDAAGFEGFRTTRLMPPVPGFPCHRGASVPSKSTLWIIPYPVYTMQWGSGGRELAIRSSGGDVEGGGDAVIADAGKWALGMPCFLSESPALYRLAICRSLRFRRSAGLSFRNDASGIVRPSLVLLSSVIRRAYAHG